MKELSRGLRLHNPGNIRHSTKKWKGEVSPSIDPELKQFISEAYGYHALLKSVLECITHFGCTTPRRVIARWAPPSGNPTVAYLDFVCRNSKIGPDLSLKVTDERQMCTLVAAMSHYENGLFPRMKEVIKGWKLLHSDNPF